jgi:hypothetical protein
VRDRLRRFADLCRENSQDGYRGAALEALGLVVYRFHRDLVGALDAALADADPDLPAYYWHGVGRAIYLSSEYVLPWQPIDWPTVARIAPDGPGQRNVIAGLAWALTLINMRHPRVMEGVLRRHGAALSEGDAFADGVTSSVAVRYDITPGAEFLGEFCQHGERIGRPDLAALWDRLVARPCRDVVERVHPNLTRARRLDRVFCYRCAAGGDRRGGGGEPGWGAT